MYKLIGLVTLSLIVTACVVDVGDADDPELAEAESELIAANKLAANKLAANKLAANKLAANKLAATSLQTMDLMSTATGREVMSFIVGCALPATQSITLKDPANVSYTYSGLLNLAPAWATRAPTVTERRWVTACLLARTNLYGTTVNISMRHDTNSALATTAAERATYTIPEGAFYGDLFGTTPLWYACATRSWSQAPTNSFRACALSSNGTTTDCGFTYTGFCDKNVPACTDKTAPFGACKGGGVTYAEVITIFLTSSQQAGQPQ